MEVIVGYISVGLIYKFRCSLHYSGIIFVVRICHLMLVWWA